LAILGTSRNGLGDRWHIADGTEKNPPKSAGCGLSGKAPWADRWHIADVTPGYANGRPNHCTKCHSRQIRCRVVARSSVSGESVFNIDGCGTLRTVALRRPIFEQEKGSATISLGLNYCSMASSHSLSRDTVSLIKPPLSWKDLAPRRTPSWNPAVRSVYTGSSLPHTWYPERQLFGILNAHNPLHLESKVRGLAYRTQCRPER
jgi:hypothetical protein